MNKRHRYRLYYRVIKLHNTLQGALKSQSEAFVRLSENFQSWQRIVKKLNDRGKGASL